MTRLFSFLVMVSLLTFTSCNRTNSNSNDKETQTLYQSVLKSGKIRVGYVSYAQSYIVNSDGTHAGIFYEVLEEIAKNLGLKIEYTKEVTWDGMMARVRRDQDVGGGWRYGFVDTKGVEVIPCKYYRADDFSDGVAVVSEYEHGNIDEETATDKFYSSKTFAKLADDSTELYKKSWQEIYELLKRELNG